MLHRLMVAAGATGLTLMFFLVLPLIQVITRPATADLSVRDLDTANIPPPPPPPEEEPEKEEEEEEEPPELIDEAPPLDLSQLELAMNAGFGDGWFDPDFAVKLNTGGVRGDDLDALFDMSDLDQQPRAIYQPNPTLDAQVRRKTPGKVNIIFIVDKRGRVENPIVQNSTDPIFEGPALAAIKQWKFEPGKRKGEPVRFRMRVPITFPKGQ